MGILDYLGVLIQEEHEARLNMAVIQVDYMGMLIQEEHEAQLNIHGDAHSGGARGSTEHGGHPDGLHGDSLPGGAPSVIPKRRVTGKTFADIVALDGLRAMRLDSCDDASDSDISSDAGEFENLDVDFDEGMYVPDEFSVRLQALSGASGDAYGAQDDELMAQRFIEENRYGLEDCVELLEATRFHKPAHARTRTWTEQPPEVHATFGCYRHGPFTGLTRGTQRHAILATYLNRFRAKHGLSDSYTSITVGKNLTSGPHKDRNADETKNHVMALGTYEGGGVWLEGEVFGLPVVEMVDSSGVFAKGNVHDNKGKILPGVFIPLSLGQVVQSGHWWRTPALVCET